MRLNEAASVGEVVGNEIMESTIFKIIRKIPLNDI